MLVHDPETNFEELWTTFHERYPFFELRHVDWQEQYDRYRPQVSAQTGESDLFDILCEMLRPLNDGHVELIAKIDGKKRYFNPEKKPRFWREFTEPQIDALFQTSVKTLVASGFAQPEATVAPILHYCRSADIGYMRIFELEGVSNRVVAAAMDTISRDFAELKGFIIDIRNCPGGDDSTVITIIDRFCRHRITAFHRRTKVGPGDDELGPLRTWYVEPRGLAQFTGPVVVLTCDSVFSGGECFALAIRELPNVQIIGDHTNGIFSYQLEKKLPNGWDYRLSYQLYYSADMLCYEGIGVPADIPLFNTKADIEKGADPLITAAIESINTRNAAPAWGTA